MNQFNESSPMPSILIVCSLQYQSSPIVKALLKNNFKITFASSAFSALEEAHPHSTPGEPINYVNSPDLVISDVALSEMNGYQLCRMMKNDPLLTRIPFVLVANHPLTEPLHLDRFWSYKSGADVFVSLDWENPSQDEIDQLIQQAISLTQIYGKVRLNAPVLPADDGAFKATSTDLKIRFTHILDRALLESTLMNEFRKLDDLVYDPALLNYMLFSLLESLLEYDTAVIFFHDLVNKETVLTLHVPEGKSISEHSVQGMERLFIQELKAQSLEHKDLGPVMARCFEENTVKLSLIGQVTPDESGVTIPYSPLAQQLFVNQDSFLGAIGFYRCGIPGKSSSASASFITFPFPLILREITHLMKLRYLHSQAEMQGIQDDLTKLYNHRYFMKALDKEFQRAKRYGVDLSLGVVDIDHLRQLNEEWGHAAGDQILQWLGEKLLETFRTVDICARSSGEDIFILFPETLLTHAQMACQRLYKALHEHPFLWQGQPLDITISIGLTSLHEGIGSPSALIHEAENALSLAKEMGCNRIEVSIRSD